MSSVPAPASHPTAAGRFAKIGLIVLLLAGIAAPVVAMAVMIARHQVNIPFLDDWMFTDFYEKIATHSLTWSEFFKVQMEHRLATPRVVLWLWYHVAPRNFLWQNWVTYGLMVWNLFNIGVLIRRSGSSLWHWGAMMTLASVTVFTPVQFQIVLWPMMFQVAFLPALLSGMLVAVGTAWPCWLRFLLCALAALTGMQCLASGLLLWVLLIPVVMWTRVISGEKSRRLFLTAWVVLGAVVVSLYFHNLKNDTGEAFSYGADEGEDTMKRGLAAVMSRPMSVPVFVLNFLGGPLARGTSGSILSAGFLFGGFLLAGYLCAVAVWIRRFWYREEREAWLPWLLIGAYSIGTAVLVALGRAWASRTGENALQPRYVIHAIPLMVSLIVLGPLMVRRLLPGCSPWSGRIRLAGAALLGGYVTMQAVTWTHGAKMMAVWESARLRGATNTMFFKLPHLIAPETQVAANPERARKMDDLGLLPQPMLTSARLDQFKINRKQLAKSVADITILARFEKDSFRAEGFAVLPDRERVPDGIFFTYDDDDGTPQIFLITQVLEMPLYLGKSLGRDLRFVHGRSRQLEQEELSGFAAEFDNATLPPGHNAIRVWAFDYRRQEVQLIDRYSLDTASGKIRELRRESRNRRLRKGRAAETPDVP